jgi:hypothetical protein
MAKVARKHVNPYIAGCDRRRHGKAYLTTDVMKWLDMYPMSYFLYDPPILVEDELAWGICDQGVSYTNSGNVWHAQTIVGRTNYWNTADVLMEIMNGWASALAPLTGEKIKLLQPGGISRRLIFHRAGWIDNYDLYRREYVKVPNIQECMLPEDSPQRQAHLEGKEMCASLHWQHVENGTKRINRLTTREVGELKYTAVRPIENNPPKDRLALVAWLPIDEIDLVDSDEMEDKSDIATALEFLAGQTALPLFVTNN